MLAIPELRTTMDGDLDSEPLLVSEFHDSLLVLVRFSVQACIQEKFAIYVRRAPRYRTGAVVCGYGLVWHGVTEQLVWGLGELHSLA